MANFALYFTIRLVFTTEFESIYCAVCTESLYNTDRFRLQTVTLIRGCPVGMETSFRSDDGVLWIGLPAGTRDFCLFQSVEDSCWAHAAFCSIRTGAFYPGVKRPGCWTDHSPTSSTEVKNEWSYKWNDFIWFCTVVHKILLPFVLYSGA